MAYEVKAQAPCSKCGTPTRRRQNISRLPLCTSCAIQRATDNQISIHNRSGAPYEKWRDAMRRTFAK